MQEYKVLDHGYVKLTHKMVDENIDQESKQSLDQMVVAAARVSYGGDLKGEEKDRKLLHYLLEHEHLTPLESAVLRFEIKLPIFCMRQWIRHRWSSFNEISGRYTEEISEEFYVPDKFRAQDIKNKQGSLNNDLSTNTVIDVFGMKYNEPITIVCDGYITMLQNQQELYKSMIAAGVAKELARGILGTAFYTKFVWTVNARSLINFLILRLDPHAQWEIQEYAKVISQILKQEMKWTYDSLRKLFPNTNWE